METIGTYEAKTHLPELLQKVSRGASITITRHGHPIAILIPAEKPRPHKTREAVSALRQFRKNKRLSGLSLSKMIHSGRK